MDSLLAYTISIGEITVILLLCYYYLPRFKEYFNVSVRWHINSFDIIENPVTVDAGEVPKVCNSSPDACKLFRNIGVIKFIVLFILNGLGQSVRLICNIVNLGFDTALGCFRESTFGKLVNEVIKLLLP